MNDAAKLIARVEKVFGDVRLGDGVSLREAFVLDDYGSTEERAAARSQDELIDWRKLVDADLLTDQALCFMDEAGVRFHLPACFVTVLQEKRRNFNQMYSALLFVFLRNGSVNLLKFSLEELHLMVDIMVWLKTKTDEHRMEDLRKCIENLKNNIQLITMMSEER
jgi:hypothetical protein